MHGQTWKHRVKEGVKNESPFTHVARMPFAGTTGEWVYAFSSSSAPSDNLMYWSPGSTVNTYMWLAQPGSWREALMPHLQINDIPGGVQVKEEEICAICILYKRQKQSFGKERKFWFLQQGCTLKWLVKRNWVSEKETKTVWFHSSIENSQIHRNRKQKVVCKQLVGRRQWGVA